MLAQKFNSFYHKYPILNEKDAAERQRRAVCAEVFRRTMAGGAGAAGDSGAGENVIVRRLARRALSVGCASRVSGDVSMTTDNAEGNQPTTRAR